MKKSATSRNGSASDALPDVQQSPDGRGIHLLKAGIKDVHLPIRFRDGAGEPQLVHALISMTVGLNASQKGVNMSRFMTQLADWSRNHVLTLDLREFLRQCQTSLESASAHVEIKFRLFVDKAAPVTGLSAPMGYDVMLAGTLESLDGVESFDLTVGLGIAASNCCPCSKAISEFGAHNQRIKIHALMQLKTDRTLPQITLAQVIEDLEGAASHPVYPLLKRPDEKHVTEGQYTNPKFVEDVVRDAVLILRKYDWLRACSVEAEALESIHEHNAWAMHSETMGE